MYFKGQDNGFGSAGDMPLYIGGLGVVCNPHM